MQRLSSSPFIDRRSFLAAAGATILALAAPIEAHATTLWSPTSSHTEKGIKFTYSSGLDTGAKLTARTTIRASKEVAAGAMVAQAVVVKGLDRAVIAASKPKTNAKKAGSLSVSITLNRLSAGYRSKGKVRTFGSRWHPCASTAVGYSLAPELAANESGQTLGTWDDAERGAVPDLVAVVADSGAEGYAYWEQFDAEDVPGSIPVYAVDGSTRIGTFTFGDK